MKKRVLGLFFLFLGFSFSQPADYETVIKEVQGGYLTTSAGNLIRMIGIYIPFNGEDNYRAELHDELRRMLVGQKVVIKTKLKKHSWGYPGTDLVEVVLHGESVNRRLLTEGKVFFYEDYWNSKEKESWRVLERQAKQKRIGVWHEIEQLKLKYVRHKNWRHIYDPGSPSVARLRPADRIDYYTDVPFTWGGIRRDWSDPYSVPIWNREEKLLEEKKKLAEEAAPAREPEPLPKKEPSQLEISERNKKLEALRAEKFQIKQVGTAKKAWSFLFFTRVKGQATTFRLADGHVAWFCKFRKSFRAFLNSADDTPYEIIWTSPSGKSYLKSIPLFGNPAMISSRISLKNDPGCIGKWKVIVHRAGTKLDERNFEILA